MSEGEALHDGTKPLSTSANALPPLVPPAVAARLRHADQARNRQAFLAGFLNEDLQKIAKWHGTRPAHEQKRFLRSVDTLYKAFDAAPKARAPTETSKFAELTAKEAAAANAAAAAAAAEMDPLSGPPRDTPRARLVGSASEPALLPSRPIDVFEQRKRQAFKQDPDEDPNTLLQWLEGASVTSQTTAASTVSQRTRFSDLSVTTCPSSVCSEPTTTNQMLFRRHKRGFAINRPAFKAVNPHASGNLKDGLPSSGWPDSERFLTSFKQVFGSAADGIKVHPKMFLDTIKGESHPFVTRFLETAGTEHKEQFTSLVRSLEYLRKAGDGQRDWTTHEHEAYPEHMNTKLWKPPKQRPVFDQSQRNLSQVPLGSLSTGKLRKGRPSTSGSFLPDVPPSPTVSGLGSLPLSRLSTPRGEEY